MNKYERVKQELDTTGTSKMKVFGSSMTPIIKSGSLLTFVTQDSYDIGDVLFCKVKGRYIDAHKVIKKDLKKGYLIGNNHGYENGWTTRVFGKATTTEYKGNIKKL